MLSPAPNPEAQKHGIFVLCRARCQAGSSSSERSIPGICGEYLGGRGSLQRCTREGAPARASRTTPGPKANNRVFIFKINMNRDGVAPERGAGDLGPGHQDPGWKALLRLHVVDMSVGRPRLRLQSKLGSAGTPPPPVPTGPRPAQAGTVVSCSKQAGAPGRQQKAQVCPAPAGVWVRCRADFPAAGDEGLLGSRHCGVGAGRGERRPDKCAPAPHPTPSPSLSHEKLALKSGCSLQVRKFICWEAHLHWQLWASQGGRARDEGIYREMLKQAGWVPPPTPHPCPNTPPQEAPAGCLGLTLTMAGVGSR